jgi:molybdate transport system regulatory protein
MPLELKYKIWLEADDHVVFGQGRKELLIAIEECKSPNAAAKKLNMSYRAAWGRLKASEERLGFKLVDHIAGEAVHLTREARMLLAEFKSLEEQLTAMLQKSASHFKQFRKITPPPSKPAENIRKKRMI